MTELTENLIDVWPLKTDAMTPMRNPSIGPGPFGVDLFGTNGLVVAESAPGSPDLASVASYTIGKDGALEPVSGSVKSEQTGTSFVKVSEDERWVFATSPETGSLDAYSLSAEGQLELSTDARKDPGRAPMDVAASSDGQALYVLLGGTGAIASYDIAGDALTNERISRDVGLPNRGAQGLVAW